MPNCAVNTRPMQTVQILHPSISACYATPLHSRNACPTCFFLALCLCVFVPHVARTGEGRGPTPRPRPVRVSQELIFPSDDPSEDARLYRYYVEATCNGVRATTQARDFTSFGWEAWSHITHIPANRRPLFPGLTRCKSIDGHLQEH